MKMGDLNAAYGIADSAMERARSELYSKCDKTIGDTHEQVKEKHRSTRISTRYQIRIQDAITESDDPPKRNGPECAVGAVTASAPVVVQLKYGEKAREPSKQEVDPKNRHLQRVVSDSRSIQRCSEDYLLEEPVIDFTLFPRLRRVFSTVH